MSKPKHLTFSREFKLEAVRQLDLGEKPAADLARELGIPRNRLYKWREQLQAEDADTTFPGQGRRRGADMLFFIPHGADIAKCLMRPLPVVEHLEEKGSVPFLWTCGGNKRY